MCYLFTYLYCIVCKFTVHLLLFSSSFRDVYAMHMYFKYDQSTVLMLHLNLSAIMGLCYCQIVKGIMIGNWCICVIGSPYCPYCLFVVSCNGIISRTSIVKYSSPLQMYYPSICARYFFWFLVLPLYSR